VGKLSTRRDFVRLAFGVSGVALMASCTPAAPAAPTAPAQPTAPPPTMAAAALPPTSAPASTAVVAATAPPATAIPAATTAPTAIAAAPAVRNVPRNRTLILQDRGNGTYPEAELWSPYVIGQQQLGVHYFYEPLYFFAPFTNQWIPWLASGHDFNADYTQVTIKTRPEAYWSDGIPFTADDVVYTLNTLRALGSKVTWGVDTQRFVQGAQTVDPQTAVVQFKVPYPRFMEWMAYAFDLGVPVVPKHIFEGQDWTKFAHFDLAKGWPVTTSPWRVVHVTPQQLMFDRRDDWWAAKAGLAQMPKVERIIRVSISTDAQMAQAYIRNEVDNGPFFGTPQAMKETIAQNPKVVSWTGQQPIYGSKDWWTTSLWLNNEKPPYDNPDVRWAVSYAIDRKQAVDVAYNGWTEPATLPMPTYPGLAPYYDSVKDLLAKYPTNEFNLSKSSELMQKAGFTKGSDGFWADAQGQKVTMPMTGLLFGELAAPVGEQLKRAGFDTSYSEPPNWGDDYSTGKYTASMWGHGGTRGVDPYYTLKLYQAATKLSLGGYGLSYGLNNSRFSNDDYDALVDQFFQIHPSQQDKLLPLFHKAMDIWLSKLPDVPMNQFIIRTPMNTTYWTGWPSEQDPYTSDTHWHLGFALVLHRLQPTQ